MKTRTAPPVFSDSTPMDSSSRRRAGLSHGLAHALFEEAEPAARAKVLGRFFAAPTDGPSRESRGIVLAFAPGSGASRR